MEFSLTVQFGFYKISACKSRASKTSMHLSYDQKLSYYEASDLLTLVVHIKANNFPAS